MSAIDEIASIEADISRLTKELADSELMLVRINAVVAKLNAGRDGAQSRLDFHERNRRHMRTTADLVDINEFAKVTHQVRDHRDQLNEHSMALREAIAKQAANIARIREVRATLQKLGEQLGRYGEVRRFPTQ